MQAHKHVSVRRLFLLFLVIGTLASCGGSGGSSAPPTSPTPEPPQNNVAQAYVNEVVAIMRENVVTRFDVDWDDLETQVNQLAANATTIAEAYPAITRALELVNTNHSFLNSPGGQLITYPSNLTCQQDLDIDTPNNASVGYIRVDAFNGTTGEDGRAFANEIQAAIRQRDSAQVTAWVVDLRNNAGGNMWPMIAGLGPLFEGELLGHFFDAEENVTPWGYANGSSILNGMPLVTVDDPYSLVNPLPRVAVLSSRRVASSGEATLIAFKQQANVRMFGTNSCGLSTANQAFSLSDGSALFLTTGIMADRDQIKYGGPVEVDEVTSPEDTLAMALAWLLQ